ncbi:MAG TPA: FkbM family methyltransferase, partial [Chroococcales cyanobacterium]
IRFLEGFFRAAKGGKQVIFDVGANRGEYSRKILSIADRRGTELSLHLFEPTRSAFSSLAKDFLDSRVSLNPFAVSNSEGTAEIFFDNEGSTLSSLYRRDLACYSIAMKGSETVETVRLDRYFREKAIEHVDLLKLDIEGHELFALQGMGSFLDSAFVDLIQFEYGGANLDSRTSLRDLYRILEEAGFRIAKVMPDGLELRSYQPWMENFQYANYVALSRTTLGTLSR